MSVRRVLVTSVALVGMALTFALGQWQWGRAQHKHELQAAIEARQAQPALTQDAFLAAPGSPEHLHRAVTLRGVWLVEYAVFLDNRQMQGRPGFYVLTPMRLAGTQAVVLVQRGWVPRNFINRQQLPPVETPAGEVLVQGRIALAPSKLYAFEGADTGPIRQNLDVAAFRAETGLALVEGSVQQTGAASQGLMRDWPIPASGADKNYGYAFQWWALCGVIFILYVWFQFFASRRRQAPRD